DVRERLAHCAHTAELLRLLVEHKLLTEYQGRRIEAGRAGELLLGNYRVLDRLGSGGQGIRFPAEHLRVARPGGLQGPAAPPRAPKPRRYWRASTARSGPWPSSNPRTSSRPLTRARSAAPTRTARSCTTSRWNTSAARTWSSWSRRAAPCRSPAPVT